ncbi:hypothetical protein MASR1M45_24880 [Candidatus Kapaibacterium sp.]
MKIILTVLIILLSVNAVTSQTKWKRSEAPEQPLNLFRSVEAVSLPTSETMKSGDIYFHLSHKFLIPVSEGFEELFGLDGGVNMRIALGYGVSDDLMLILGEVTLTEILTCRANTKSLRVILQDSLYH